MRSRSCAMLSVALPIWLPLCLLGACLPVVANDGGTVTLGSACNVDSEFDVCSPKGYVCTVGDGGVDSCGYAEANDACLPSLGCDPDAGNLACYGFSADGGSAALVYFCGTACVHPTDCGDSTASCFASFVDGGRVGACLTNYCDTAYALCPVVDGGAEGTCFPDGPFGDNVCHQAGPIGTNEACSASTVDGGAYLCQQQDLCTFGAGSGETACLASCLGQGQSCPSGQSCVSDYGLCLTPCSSTNPTCPSPYTCIKLLGTGGTSVGNYCYLP